MFFRDYRRHRFASQMTRSVIDLANFLFRFSASHALVCIACCIPLCEPHVIQAVWRKRSHAQLSQHRSESYMDSSARIVCHFVETYFSRSQIDQKSINFCHVFICEAANKTPKHGCWQVDTSFAAPPCDTPWCCRACPIVRSRNTERRAVVTGYT